MRAFTRSIALGIAVVGTGLLAVPASAVLVGGTYYTNPLNGGSAARGRTSDNSTAGYTINNPLSNAVDGLFGHYGSTSATVTNTTVGQVPSFIEWTNLPFQVSTVIAVPNTSFGGGFSPQQAGRIQVDVGGTLQTLTNGAFNGVNFSSPVTVGTMFPGTSTRVRAQYDTLAVTGGTYFQVMQEILPIPDTLKRLTSTSATTTVNNAPDNTGNPNNARNDSIDTTNYWQAPTNVGAAPVTYTLNFSTPQTIGALLVTGYPTYEETFDLYTNGSATPFATGLTLVSADNNTQSMRVLKFNTQQTNVTTLTLKFTSLPSDTAFDTHLLTEVIAFQLVPEPATVSLLGLASLALLRTRRRA